MKAKILQLAYGDYVSLADYEHLQQLNSELLEAIATHRRRIADELYYSESEVDRDLYKHLPDEKRHEAIAKAGG